MKSGQCLTSADLASYVDRRLSQAERNIANEHLANCPRCIADVANVARSVAEIANSLPAHESARSIESLYERRRADHLKRCRRLCERARRVRVDPGMTGECLASSIDDETALQFIEALIDKLEG